MGHFWETLYVFDFKANNFEELYSARIYSYGIFIDDIGFEVKKKCSHMGVHLFSSFCYINLISKSKQTYIEHDEPIP